MTTIWQEITFDSITTSSTAWKRRDGKFRFGFDKANTTLGSDGRYAREKDAKDFILDGVIALEPWQVASLVEQMSRYLRDYVTKKSNAEFLRRW